MSLTKRISLSLLLLFAILSPLTTLLPVGFGKFFILVSLPFFLLALKSNNFYINKNYLISFVLMLLLTLYVFFHINYAGAYEYSMAYIFFLNFSEFMLIALIYSFYLQKYLKEDSLILFRLLVIAILINSIVIYLNIAIPSTRSGIQSIIPVSGNLPADYLYRVGGLSNSPSADLAILHSFGAVFAYYLGRVSNNIRLKFYYTFISLIILGSILFISRTGFFLFFIVIGLFELYNIISIKRAKEVFKSFIIFLGCFLLFLFLIVIFIKLLLNSEQLYMFERYFIPWAFEVFLSYMEGGEVQTGSTNDLFRDHLFLPTDEKIFLYGAGNYLDHYGGHFVDSDSGYVRFIFALGLIGSIIVYSFFPILYLYLKKFIFDKYLNLLVLCMLIGLFIVEIKMPFMFAGKITIVLYLIFFTEIYKYSLRKNNAV